MCRLTHAKDFVENERRYAGADISRLLGSDPGPQKGFEPSAKLRSRIKRLAQWRLDPSSITFQEDFEEVCGGHATVLKAHRYWWKQPLAVKKTRIADDMDLERALGVRALGPIRNRFWKALKYAQLTVRETEFLAELDHPNIVKLEGFVEDLAGGLIWLVFLWASNGNLKEFVASSDWKIPERVSLINDVVQGLAYLHSRDPPICHGDLKSFNVLVDWQYRAAITDFGSARRLAQNGHNTLAEQNESPLRTQPLQATFYASKNTITLTGKKYTLRWAAPELLYEDRLGPWSDIWALGWIVYEVMTNSIPFAEDSAEIVVVERVINGELPSLSEKARLSLIQELCSLVTLCWNYSPTERPTAEDCQRAIEWMPRLVPKPARAADVPKSTAPSAELLIQLGDMRRRRSQYEGAFACFTQALQICTGTGDRHGRAAALWRLADIHRCRSEYNEARANYSEALQIWAELTDALRSLAQEREHRYEDDEAVGLYSQDQKIRTELGYRKGQAKALWGLAQVYHLQNNHEEAITLYTKALHICTELGDKQGVADALWGLAEVHRHRWQDRETILLDDLIHNISRSVELAGAWDRLVDPWRFTEAPDLQNYHEAIRLYADALSTRTELGDKKGRVDALCRLAEMHRRRSRYEKAAECYSEALQIHTELGDGGGKIDALRSLAHIHHLQDNHEKAVTLYTEALHICTELGERRGRASALQGLAEVHRDQGQHNQAISLYSTILYIYNSLEDRKSRADILRGLAQVYHLQNDHDKAVTLYTEALYVFIELGERKGRPPTLLGLAEVHRDRSEYDKANPLYTESSSIYAELNDRKGEADTLWGLAQVHHLQNNHKEAMLLYVKVSYIRSLLGDRKGRADALWGLARVLQDQHQYHGAIRLYDMISAIYAEIDDREGSADTLWDLAEVHNTRSKAIALYIEVLQLGPELSGRKDRARVLQNVAIIHRPLRQSGRAAERYCEAFYMSARCGDGKGTAEALLGLAEAMGRCLADQAMCLADGNLRLVDRYLVDLMWTEEALFADYSGILFVALSLFFFLFYPEVVRKFCLY